MPSSRWLKQNKFHGNFEEIFLSHILGRGHFLPYWSLAYILWFLILCFMVSVCICVPHVSLFFCLFCFILFCLFNYFSGCFFSKREKEDEELAWWRGGENPGGYEEGKM